ncbi:MAG: hypothetical protein ACRC9P_04950 [Bacteroides sp.]
MYTIQANSRNTRFIEVSEKHLETIRQYKLFNQLPNSHGLISEEILEKLRLTVRSLIASQEENSKDLLDLCIDVIYHKDMKAFGLNQLYELYTQKYRSNQEVKDSDEE